MSWRLFWLWKRLAPRRMRPNPRSPHVAGLKAHGCRKVLIIFGVALLAKSYLAAVPPWHGSRVSTDRTHHLRGPGPEALYEHRFDEVLPFHEPGLAPVQQGKHAWHIFANGSRAYERSFSRTFGFYEGRAAVIEDGWYFHILPSGEELYQERFDAWQVHCFCRDLGF